MLLLRARLRLFLCLYLFLCLLLLLMWSCLLLHRRLLYERSLLLLQSQYRRLPWSSRLHSSLLGTLFSECLCLVLSHHQAHSSHRHTHRSLR